MSELFSALWQIPAAPGPESFLAVLTGKGSLVVSIGILVCAVMSHSAASTRHVIWTATLAGLLFLPMVSVLAPPVFLPLLPGPQNDGFTVLEPVTSDEPVVGDRARVAPILQATSERLNTASPGPFRFLAAIYLAGVLAVLAYFATGWVGVWRLTRAAERLALPPEWQSLLADRSASFRGARSPELLASRSLPAPVTWGFWKPTVLLPSRAGSWRPSDLRHALLHEFAHIERRDWATQLLAHVACSLYWFHPLVWLAARQQALEAERACDDQVLASGAESSDYASQLLMLARRLRAEGPWHVTALSMVRRSQLRQRIQSILDSRRSRSLMSPIKRHVVFALACFPGVLMSPVYLVAAATGEPQVAVQERDDSLIRAARRGDLEAAGRALRRGADIDEPVDGLGTPLIQAAAAGKLEMIEYLIENGADVNQVATGKSRPHDLLQTALATAARAGHLEIVRVLLNAGAEVDRAPQGDGTALLEASGGGHAETVELLVERGADVNRVVPGDGTSLIAAARSGSLATVELLMAAGADPDRHVSGDESPIHHAAASGNEAVVAALVAAGVDVDTELPGDGTPLILAARGGHVDATRVLLDGGADADLGVGGDGNAMIQAASRGDTDLLRLLIDGGADVNAEVHGDGNALIAAARAGHLEAVRLLVESGADIERVVPRDENPLIQAAGAGRLDVVRHLIEQGADVNVSVLANGHEVRTPLLQASRGGHAEVADFLRTAGARD